MGYVARVRATLLRLKVATVAHVSRSIMALVKIQMYNRVSDVKVLTMLQFREIGFTLIK